MNEVKTEHARNTQVPYITKNNQQNQGVLETRDLHGLIGYVFCSVNITFIFPLAKMQSNFKAT